MWRELDDEVTADQKQHKLGHRITESLFLHESSNPLRHAQDLDLSSEPSTNTWRERNLINVNRFCEEHNQSIQNDIPKPCQLDKGFLT